MNLNSSLKLQSSSTSLSPGSGLGLRVVNGEDSAPAIVPLEVERGEVRVAGFSRPPRPDLRPKSREWGRAMTEA